MMRSQRTIRHFPLTMNRWLSVSLVLCMGLASMLCAEAEDKTGNNGWMSLFNGKDFEGWRIKI